MKMNEFERYFRNELIGLLQSMGVEQKDLGGDVVSNFISRSANVFRKVDFEDVPSYFFDDSLEVSDSLRYYFYLVEKMHRTKSLDYQTCWHKVEEKFKDFGFSRKFDNYWDFCKAKSRYLTDNNCEFNRV